MTTKLNITIWNEGLHEIENSKNMSLRYPRGIHGALSEGLQTYFPDSNFRIVTLSDGDEGLSEEILQKTDVLLWWGHLAHEKVSDITVSRVQKHVLGGMGLVPLHSAHFSKIFIKLLGTTCSLKWRNNAEREIVWNVNPTHPISEGIDSSIVIGQQEMYGEFFDIPKPDDVIFISSFSGGEVFRSGITFTRGKGRIFYFSPGDQDYPVYYNPHIIKVIANGIRWVERTGISREPFQVHNSIETL